MKAILQSTFVLLAVCVNIASAAAVVDLTSANFADFVNSHEVVMTQFYAPWCGICKELEPLYEETASILDSSQDIKFARVDCVAEPDLCKTHRVPIYPTIFLFKGTEKSEIYNGKRELKDMITFAKKRYLPPITTLTEDTFEEFKTSGKRVVIGYWEEGDSITDQIFTNIAQSLLDDYEFGMATDKTLARDEGIIQPGIILYKQYDDPKITYRGPFSEELIKQFLKDASLPLIGDLNGLTYSEFKGKALACVFAETEEERHQLGQEIRPIARRTQDSIRWITADANKHKTFASRNMHLKDGAWPAFGLLNSTDKYPFNQENSITRHSVSQFVNDYLERKLSPHILSEPIPVQVVGNVTVIVRDNFQEIVLDGNEDVLLEFYAPWCGHCKRLAPEYERLAQIYHRYSKRVIIAKVDATVNDIPEHPISSYPTIKLFPGNAKGFPIQYSGDRSIEDLARFIRDSGTGKIDVLRAVRATSASEWIAAVRKSARAAIKSVTGYIRDEL